MLKHFWDINLFSVVDEILSLINMISENYHAKSDKSPKVK